MQLTRLIVFLFLIILSLHTSQAQVSQPGTDTTSITLNSKILGEQSKAFVSLPAGYNSTTEKYPVIYVLDGEYYFSFTSDAVKTLYQSERMPPSIVIGITTNNRERDFTPAGDKNWQSPKEMKSAGGADKFLNYLEGELIPYVEKNYRTQPFRVIIGHSLGGLLALHAFSAKPNLFQAYIALESSLWWNDGSVGKALINYLTAQPNYKGKLFLSRLKMPREVWFPINVTVVDYLEKNHPAGLDYKYMEIDDETHSTMVFPTTYFGLRDIFSDYLLKLDEKATEQTIMPYYKGLSAKYGYPVMLPQQIYNFLWNISMNAKNYKEAVNFGELRIKNYPNSYRAYIDLSQTYIQTGNKDMAIKLLTKASELNPKDESVKQTLNDLSKK